ncbi:IS110 family transposase [Gordonia aquimaris]|uniref:IS110 family transposase n=1 Tax=Gordonia aquimaris TaxID=2984863 RepID=A0A9X3DBK5_9ACTN|nr:IS110 family transposase [Gordonia aquimaris]MCX2967252.1 IS110 family transposase [Gordonia aquimaris]
MIMVGADVHKRTHTFVAVDEAGRQLAQKTVKATTTGHRQVMQWARERFDDELQWAIEDCRNLSTRLERDLLGAGATVVRVPPHLMAEYRRIGRSRGKSDPIDALAVARAALREPDLPVAEHDAVSRELKLLTDHRETLVAQRTAIINRLLWHVHEIDPGYHIAARSMDRKKQQNRVGAWLADAEGVLAELARELLADIVEVTGRINSYERRLAAAVAPVAPTLLDLLGCGALTAAKIVGETANITRFATDAKFARHAGVAPIPVWSGNTAGRVRLTRSGNRQLNAAIHRIAITQIGRKNSLGRAYYDRKQQEGKTTKEALRCLKRRLTRIVFTALTTDHNARTQPDLQTAA